MLGLIEKVRAGQTIDESLGTIEVRPAQERGRYLLLTGGRLGIVCNVSAQQRANLLTGVTIEVPGIDFHRGGDLLPVVYTIKALHLPSCS
jgi:hypothetical protein